MAVMNRWIESIAHLSAAPRGMEFDFAQPIGEEALVSPDSVSWRIFKNPVTLFIGGVAAVILELAEPSVRTGVWDHSTFRKDAVMRLRRTGAATMMTVYGPRSAAESMIARVVRMHDRVEGQTPDGKRYRANDPRLLNWVQATASFGFIEAYARYAGRLTVEERSQAFEEGTQAAVLFGADRPPTSVEAWERMLADFEPGLEGSAIIFEFLDIMDNAAIAPRPLRYIQRLLVRAAVDIVPADIRRKLGLDRHGLRPFEAALVRAIARIAERIPLRFAPPARASVRVGRSATFLYGGPRHPASELQRN